MMKLRRYKRLIEDFSRIDLDSSLVSFSQKKVNLGGTAHTVTLPKIKEKPCAFFRMIQRIIDFFFGKSRYLNTAQQLEHSICDAMRVLSKSELVSELVESISETASKVIGKLSKAAPNYKSEISHADRNIKSVAAAAAKSTFLKKIREACAEQELQRPGSFEVAYSMDWEKDDPVLFDLSYVNELFLSMQNQRNGQLHSDLKNKFITSKDKNIFSNFLYNLMGNGQIKDHYGNLLSIENTSRLRQMTLAILNILNSRRQEAGFEQLYASVVFQICRALDNCSNGINTNIENIFTELSFPKDGAIGLRTKLVLQSMRDRAFRAAILHCIQTSDRPAYYLEHEAASVNYYFSRMAEMVGLPISISAGDQRFQAYALIDQEMKVLEHFNNLYTPERIVQVIWEKIHDHYDSSIPTRLFTEWVESNYSLEQRYGLLDDSGNYKVEVVVQYLQELGVIKSKD